jgi:hypothetical protein
MNRGKLRRDEGESAVSLRRVRIEFVAILVERKFAANL